MTELAFPDFPAAEYVSRYTRTQQVLKQHGLDALFLTDRQNLRYFVGLRDGTWDANHFYFLTLIPAEGTPVLFVANGFNHLVQQCWIETVTIPFGKPKKNLALRMWFWSLNMARRF
jgi:Xaa-Pro aminopeptidase